MRILARLGLLLLTVFVIFAALAGWELKNILSDLPDATSLRNYRPPLVTSVYSREGVLMAEFFEERRKLIKIEQLPKVVVQAFLAAEDSHFFSHEGLDWQGIARAAWTNLKEGRVVQGGSTITQQVAKSLLLTSERSFYRKIREAVLAVHIEKNLSKQEILHLYLNQIYLGHGSYGVESASEIYFGIPSEKLNLSQAAMLAGLPQAPSRYDPYQRQEACFERRRHVLDRMSAEGWITEEEAKQASIQPIELAGLQNPYYSVSPYFSEHIRRLLEEKYGRATILRGGLEVVATTDMGLQEAARKALRRGLEAVDRRQGYRGPVKKIDPAVVSFFEKDAHLAAGSRISAAVKEASDKGIVARSGGVDFFLKAKQFDWAVPHGKKTSDVFNPGDVILCDLKDDGAGGLTAELVQEPLVEGALFCLDPNTGEVLAIVGGYDFSRSQFNRAVQAQRQPGSSLKPLIFSAALNKGYTAASLVYDSPIVYDSPDLDDKWKPKNYSKRFYGATTLREALVHSRNIVTVKVLREMGVPYTVNFLKGLGMRSPLNADLSLALGASNSTLLEMASLYAEFPSGGIYREPFFIQKIKDRDQNVLEEHAPAEGERVLDEQTAYILTNMMQGVIKEGTGAKARGLTTPAAGKTGTTDENRDAWFIGFTPNLVAAVWVGFDDGSPLGRSQTGGGAAAPIWRDFMGEAVKTRPAGEFKMPDEIEFARIDAETGLLAGPNSKKTFTAAFKKGTVPSLGEDDEVLEESVIKFDPRDPGSMDALR